MMFYEIHYEMKDGGKVYCGDVDSEDLAMEEIRILSQEFPENNYYYEVVEQ